MKTQEWKQLEQELMEGYGEAIEVLIKEQAYYKDVTWLEMAQWIDKNLTQEEAFFFLLDGVLPF